MFIKHNSFYDKLYIFDNDRIATIPVCEPNNQYLALLILPSVYYYIK